MIIFLCGQIKGSVDWICSLSLVYYGVYPIFTTEGKLSDQTFSDLNCKRLLQSIRTVNLYQLKMHFTFFKG